MKKRLLSLSLALALCLSLSAPSLAAGQTFEDVPPTYWAYEVIEEAYRDGVVGGTYHDPATGIRRYSPDDAMTMAQFIAIMTRAFYADEVNASTAVGTWYARNEAVAKANGLLNDLPGYSMEAAVTRYEMATIMCAIMRDQGATMPNAKERSSVVGEISDWGSVPFQYRQHVADVYYLKIINGFSDGSFGGYKSMTRAQCATIFVRLKNALFLLGADIELPEAPVEPDTPVTPPASAAAIGTISSSKVTLSLDTHSVDYVQDYWSEQSAEIQRLTADSKQAFNAYVHSLIHKDIIGYQGEFGTGLVGKSINQRYNYAVYKPAYTSLGIVENAARQMYYSLEGIGPSSSNGLWFFTTNAMSRVDQLMPIFEQYLDRISPNMSDRAKADQMMLAVTDNINYQVEGGANWTNGKATGDCDSYALMVAQLFSAAGLPNIVVVGETYDGAGHMWNQVYLPATGEWLIYDGTHYEGNDSAGPLSFEVHANMAEYDNDKYNNTDQIKVCRALIETACRYAG